MTGNFLDPTIKSRQCGQYQKQQSICRRVQREVEEAMDEHGEASGERACRHPAPELIGRLPAGEARLKEDDHEKDSKSEPDDPGVRDHLQVIIVRLFQAVKAVELVILRKSQPEGA